jgi:hypothetical protein
VTLQRESAQSFPSDQTCRTLSSEDDNLITGNNINRCCVYFETNDFALGYAESAAAKRQSKGKTGKPAGKVTGGLITVV